jgi:DNA-directed RNA polymerase specialized sigma54-like protein
MALRQQLIQKLEQRLSPQQIQLMKLLQVPTMELDQRIKQELEENPALEEGQEIEEDDYDNQDDYDDEHDDNDDFDLSDYLDDDIADYKETGEALRFWFDKTPDERDEAGQKGRKYFMSDETGLSAEHMGKRFISDMNTCFINWKPRKRHELIKI